MDVDEDQPSKDLSQDTEGKMQGINNAEGASSTNATHQSEKRMTSTKSANAKQLAVRKKIEQYFHRLTQGCSRKNCTNPNCASNPSFKKLSGNEAAAKSITLLQQKAEICLQASAEERPDDGPSSSSDDSKSWPKVTTLNTGELKAPEPLSVYATHEVKSGPHSSRLTPVSTKTKDRSRKKLEAKANKEQDNSLEIFRLKEVKFLTEEMVDDLIAKCQEKGEKKEELSSKVKSESKDSYSTLFCELTEVFSNMEGLNRSFLKRPELGAVPTTPAMAMDVDTTSNAHEGSTAEDMEVETSDLPDSANPSEDTVLSTALASYLESVGAGSASSPRPNTSQNHLRRPVAIKRRQLGARPKTPKEQVCVLGPTVDVESVRRVYQKLIGIDRAGEAFVRSLEFISLDTDTQLQFMRHLKKTTVNLNMFVTIMENPMLHSPEYLDTALPGFCKCMAALPMEAKAELVKFWSKYEAGNLRVMVQCLQQLLTYKVLRIRLETENDDDPIDLHGVAAITNTVKCLKLLYYASLLGGKMDREADSYEPQSASKKHGGDKWGDLDHKVWKDLLSEMLGVAANDVIEPLLPPEEFQNELLNETFNVYNDFTNSSIEKVNDDEFTFMNHPFILNTVNKTTYFFYDNKIQMLNGRRMMILQSIINRAPISPYLRLKIRRDHVIADALVRLEMVSTDHPEDLRKQLYVEFEEEQGVDEGGVSKEFFQLVVEQIFNPDYGMFTFDEKTNLFWFNAHSFENKAQFTLIGIVLGLAIYNSCILDIKFPPVVYKKLIGKKARFADMKESHPVLFSGLRQLLEYDGNVGDDMMATFSVEYSDMFGTSRKHELKPDGENILVTKENREEYVDLYANWLLNESVAEQFNAFRHGFELVVAKSPLKYMFRTDELEVLISGSQEYDFVSLESTTEYDGGFSKDSQTVKDFWFVVHEMTDDDKRNLLQFTTGTGRAPVGGLSQLRLVIARNGPDSARLPTAHTCFNVILLPDYSNREKLKERLHKAITHSKGFGML